MRVIFAICLSLFFLSTESFGQASFLYNGAAYVGNNGAQNLATVEEDTSEASTTQTIYIPLDTGANQDQHSIIAPLPDTTGASTDAIMGFAMTHTYGTGVTKRFYIASKVTDSSWRILEVASSGTPVNFAGASFLELNTAVNESVDIYLQLDATVGGCQDPACTYPAAAQETTTSFTLYAFDTDTSVLYNVNNTGDYPVDHPTGFFVDVQMSSDVYAESPAISDLRPGDGNLVVDVSTSGISLNGGTALNTVVVLYKDNAGAHETAAQPAQNINTATSAPLAGSIRLDLDPIATNAFSTFRIDDLTNNEPQNVGIGLLDKFKFVTLISPSEIETPKEIAAFLEEHQCYFVSAGFKRQHYVLKFFKGIRDKFLKKFSLGRSFTRFYYRHASEYAHHIYHSKFLSALVVASSFALYGILKYWGITLVISAMLGLVFWRRRQRSKLLLQDRAQPANQ